MVMLCNAAEFWKPRQAGPYSRFCVGFDSDWSSPNMNGSENENTCCSRFSKHSPRKPGTSSAWPLPYRLVAHVQGHCTFLQSLALCAIAKPPPEPAAGLSWGTVCTPLHVCTKKGHKARRREGDKWFSGRYFLSPDLTPNTKTSKLAIIHSLRLQTHWVTQAKKSSKESVMRNHIVQGRYLWLNWC